MTTKISKKQLEDLQDLGAKIIKTIKLDFNIDEISVRETTEEYDRKHPHLTARELVVKRGDEESVLIGYKYDADEQIGSIYKKKSKGGKETPLTVDNLLEIFSNLSKADENNVIKANEMQDFIKDRTKALFDILSTKSPKQEPQVAQDKAERKVRKTELPKGYIKTQNTGTRLS